MSKKAQKQPWITLKNSAEDPNSPAEILIYEPIGRDPWSENGLNSKDFKAVLDSVQPRNRDLLVRINSKGGDVHDGFAIKSMLDSWPGRVTAIIDGIAASTASWVYLGADEVQAAKSSQVFIHDAITIGWGNSSTLRKAADDLDITSDQIAGIYAEKTGKTQSEMRDMMRKETLMPAMDALKLGLIDKISDSTAIHNFTSEELDAMKAKLRTLNAKESPKSAPSAGNQTNHQIMNRDQMLALLKEHGVAVSNEATDEQLQAALKELLKNKPSADNKQPAAPPINVVPAEELLKVQNQLADLKKANDEARKLRIANAVDSLIANDQLPAAMREKTINRAMGDESLLEELKALPSRPPGAEPVKPMNIDGNASAVDVAKAFNRFNEAADSWRRGNDVQPKIIATNSLEKGVFFNAHREKLISLCSNYEGLRLLNAAGDNTLPAGLQTQVILAEMIRAFAKKLLALNVFSTVFSNVALQGTDKINVPFYDLETAASTDWNASNGYVIGTTTTDTREITINKRKYQALSVTSSLYRRQPFYNMLQLLTLKAEKLGVDVFTDVLSVVTASNFGDPVLTKDSALIDGDDITAIRTACNKADWPEVGRALIVNADIDGALLADPTIKSQSDFGSSVQQSGKLPTLRGFDYIWNSNIPTNSENLTGMAVHRSAVLVATSPIEPHPNVRASLARYEVVTDPSTGISFEYRSDADTAHDIGRETVEANYGYAKGNASALKRITSA